MAVYDDIDLRFNWNGDFDLGPDGDLAHTTNDRLESVRQEIHDICASALGDWEVYPNRGASLDDFVGEPNTRLVGDRIHDRLRIALTSAGVVLEDDLDIRVVPVHLYRVLIVVKINAVPTPFNNLAEEKLIVSLVFDFLEQGITFYEKPPMLLLSNPT